MCVYVGMYIYLSLSIYIYIYTYIYIYRERERNIYRDRCVYTALGRGCQSWRSGAPTA